MTQKNPQDQRTEQYPEDRQGNPGHGKDRQNRQDQEQKKMSRVVKGIPMTTSAASRACNVRGKAALNAQRIAENLREVGGRSLCR